MNIGKTLGAAYTNKNVIYTRVCTKFSEYFEYEPPCARRILPSVRAAPHYYGSVMQFYDVLSAGANCIYSYVVNITLSFGRGVVILLILGVSSYQNHFWSILSEILGAQTLPLI